MHVLIVLLLLLFSPFTATSNNPATLITQISVNCGSMGVSAAPNGREWVGDLQSKISPLLQIKGSSTTSTVIHSLTSADSVPHKTARISRSQFSYAFRVSPGQKILRLHFNSAPYKGFKRFNDLFTVEAGPFTLLSNFSASLTVAALAVNSFAKEFCLSLEENQTLNITFSPVSSQSRDITYAFINGIEIIPVPMHLSYFKDGDLGAEIVGQKLPLYIDSATALELVHRENVRGDSVLSSDHSVIKPNENESNNVARKISVYVGFRYLVRIHFSDLGLWRAEKEAVIFKVLINELIVDTNIEVLKERKDRGILRYREYVVVMKGRKEEGRRDLLISLQSYDEFKDGYELIKGFEILKLSNPDNSLASPNVLPPVRDTQSWIIQILMSGMDERNAIATVLVAMVAVINTVVYKLRKIWEAGNAEDENKPSARAEQLCRRFSLYEIQSATRDFSDGLVIGRGGFGKVYKGLIDKGQKTVAIKRLKSNSRQGAHEFLTEIETLSELRHINLVSLIGYCSERREMILVYEYMACGTLADHLYKLASNNNHNTNLTWNQRLNICIGAARGLDYLHTGQAIIHRDIKASNILLDENFVAKVSDFGLAKPEDRSKLQSHVSTKVKGTFGYFDPYYFSTHKLTRKSDTYAFGVVMLEVLCGRAAIDSGVSEDERILTKWAQDKISKGEVDQIVSSSLREGISPNSLKTFVEVAERCLHDEPKNRPTMSQVVLQLEVALDQQELKQDLALNEIASVSGSEQPAVAFTDMQNPTLPQNERTDNTLVNANLTSGRKHERKSTKNKSSRLWPWDAFRNRAKSSKKNELLLSDCLTTEEEGIFNDIKLAKFDWDTIVAATNNFSSSNVVGRGGFGMVYKAVLPTGQVVTVKRHSPCYAQGLKFKNEVLLLPNPQHQNIVKLLGYCTHREEKLLVHEFMENRSLSNFIDKEQSARLQWGVRFKIITGIAQGLVYLHQDSGLRIIHRDLKPSHILLDIEMNPKISDFTEARSLAEHHSELETTLIVGTYGYMSAEYCLYGRYSGKSDVYSFGIIVLEILSGRRLWKSDYSEPIMALPDYAWKLWNEGKALDLVDKSLEGAFSGDEALRCIQVGLLCIQWQPHHRPEMRSVLKMLVGEEQPGDPQYPGRSTLREDSTHSNEYTNIDGVHSNATFELDDTLER